MDKTKSKKLITIVLVISALLGLAAIATAYYFYQIRDVTPQDSGANLAQGCGCYYAIETKDVTSCADVDPKMAFEFIPGVIQNDVCTAQCDTREAAEVKNIDGSEFKVLACNLSSFSANPGCLDMAIQDTTGKRIGDGVLPSDTVTVSATFNIPEILSNPDQEYYEGYYFIANGNRIDIAPDSAEVIGTGTDREFTVSTQISDYEGADKLAIQAFGSPITQGEITSEACLREITIFNTLEPLCSNLTVEVISGDTPVVNEVVIETTGVDTPESLSITFTVGNKDTALTTTDVADKYSSDESLIILDKDFLYNADNFTGSDDFSVLDTESTTIDISAQLVVNGEVIDSDACVTAENISTRDPNDVTDPNTDEDPDTTDTTTDEDPDTTDTTDTTTDNDTSDTDTTDGDTTTADDTGETSDFTVVKEASSQCREHEAPNNEIIYTITITNNDSTYEDISSVTDKLPLGFNYVEGSTLINEIEVTDAEYVTVTEVGDTEELVWQVENGWSVNASDTLTIEFTALISDTALTGDNLNEVVVVPVNNPVNADALRTEVSIEVAQSCTAPETALFDSTVAKIILGLMVLVFGVVFYNTSTGTTLTEKFISSDPVIRVYKTVKLFGWKLTDPRKYFEEKTVDVIDRKKKRD